MPIQVSCPQCQKAYSFPDDKRGKQVRCQDCFQVFHAGEPTADAESQVLEPEIVPDIVPTPAPKPKARPQPTAAVRPAPKPAPKKTAPTSKPVREAPRPTAAPPRRRKSGALGMMIVAVLFLLLMAGGAGATVGVLWYLHVPPFQAASADTHQTVSNSVDAPAPDKTDPVKPNPADKPKDPPPDKPKDPPPDKPKDPPPAANLLTRENFDKIDRGMTVQAVTDLLGKGPDSIKPVGQPGELTVTWKSADNRTVIDVSVSDGKVKNKYSSPNWPTVYPSDVAQNPPPDKPADVVTKANFDRIARGMTRKEVTDLLGPADNTIPLTGKASDASLSWAGKDRKTLLVVTILEDRVNDKACNAGWPVVWSDVVKNPPPDKPAGDMTKETFDKIAKGMSLDDLVALAGQPTTSRKVDPTTTAYVGVDTQVTYVVVGGAVVVNLLQGKVVEKKCNLLRWPVVWPADVVQNPPPDKPAGGVTKDKYEKIDKGMSEADVIALLGPPIKAQDVSGVDADRLLDWRLDNGPQVLVTLKQDKVTGKTNFQQWPNVYPSDVAKNPPADKPTPGLTKENYLRVVKGMPDKELLDLFGQPTQVRAGDGNETILTWLGTGPVVTVTTRGGKVWKKENDQKWSNLEPPPDKNPPMANPVTQANFDKIDKGMTLDDLTKLLGGPPTSTVKIAQPDWDTQWDWTALDGATIGVQASQGKTVNKTSTQKWPVAWPSDAAKNPPPDKPPMGVTKEVYDKIDKGMEARHLFELLGKPPQADQAIAAGMDLKFDWTAPDGKTTISALLLKGKVVLKDNNAGWPTVYPGDAANKNPPPDNPDAGVTQTNFNKIAKGMTATEVSALVGSRFNKNPIVQGAQLSWVSQDFKVTITVSMKDGKVVDKGSTANWPVAWPADVAVNPPPPPPDKPDPTKFAAALTKENFNKIGKGMTKDAVTDLFGPPAEVKPMPGFGVDERLVWQGDGFKVMVSVAGGKVVSKFTTNDWPVVYP